MADNKKEWSVDFVNIEIKYPIEALLEEDEYPTAPEMFTWIGDLNRRFVKVTFGYNERSRSHTATATDSGWGKTTDKPRCITQHGKSPESALIKLYFLIQICGLGGTDQVVIDNHLGEREDIVSQKLAGLLKK